jgi:hypothetical protein
MTDETELASVQEKLEELEQKSEQIGELLERDRRKVEIEVVDEEKPVVAVNGIEMVPVRQVDAWIEGLQDRIDELADVAEEREKQRRGIDRELTELEDLVDHSTGGGDGLWLECRVDKAYKTQEKLVEDGQYCALGPDFADELGVTEGQEVRVRKADQSDTTAVYTVGEVREQEAQLRISNKGRKRLDTKDTFKAEITADP